MISDTCSQETPPPNTASTAEYLEAISKRMVSLINKQDWTHPDWYTYIAEDFEVYPPNAFLDNLSAPITATRAEYINNYMNFRKSYPDYDICIDWCEAHIDEKRGVARTWMNLMITGHPPNVRHESVSVFGWVRREGRWIAVRQTGIRGVPGY